MKGDFQARFRENLRVKFPRVTRLGCILADLQNKDRLNRIMKVFNCLLILLLSALNAYCQDTLPGYRDPWYWPFSQNSIWNQPIGSDAIYSEAYFEAANNVGVDIQHILDLNDVYPVRDVLGTEVWGPGRCDGTQYLGFTLPVPDSWIVPDAGESPYGLTPNSNFALKLAGSDSVFEGSQISRCIEAGPVYMPIWMQYPNNRKYQSIKSNGLNGGGQGASGMSALGGTIRKGEFVSDNPIRHAIKINPWAAKYCYYNDTLPGYKWPAISADNYAGEQYAGENPNIVMGSLFAIPPQLTGESIGITTIPGNKLFFTMQNYGVYFTEDAAWDTWDVIIERDAELEFENTFGYSMNSETWENELNKLMQALSVVTNNSPDQIGGGGTPLQPFAPDFSENSAGIETKKNVGIEMYPNPLEGEFLLFNDMVSFELFTLQGNLIADYKNANSVMLNIKAGVYILKLSRGDCFTIKKLIKQ